MMRSAGIRKEPVYAPTRVSIDNAVRCVDVGLSHCIALSECGSKVYTWGKGLDGQLGLGHLSGNSTPQLVKNLKGCLVAVSAGFYHSAVISSEGTLFVWGRGMASVLRSGPQSG
jgi:alpha-tubulin suppressor-like RCC1 family protein